MASAWEWRDGERVPVEADDYCVDCLNARGPKMDRHCTATSDRWDRRFHRWASVVERGNK